MPTSSKSKLGETTRQAWRKKRFCAHGHKLAGDNIYIFTDFTGKEWRRCVTCRDDTTRYKLSPERRKILSETNRRYAIKHREKIRLKNRKRNLGRYGVTIEWYDEKLRAQSGVCAICRCSCVTGKNLAVDHDHETEKVRGLLCTKCNQGIAFFGHDQEILQSAIQYLNIHSGIKNPATKIAIQTT